MITAASLKSCTAKDLAQMAKRRGVSGWHAMKKDELVKALLKASKPSPAKAKSRATISTARGASPKSASAKGAQANRNGQSTGRAASATKNGAAKTSRNGAVVKNASKGDPSNGSPSNGSSSKSNGHKSNGVVAKSRTNGTKARNGKVSSPKATSPKVVENIRSIQQQREMLKDMAAESSGVAEGHDRIMLLVRDSYWIHAYWEISRKAVDRAKASLAEYWHTAKPMLRVMQLDGDGSNNAAERVVRQIEIHGGVKNWYIDVPDPPKSYRCHLGYLASNGRFHTLVRSNVVTTPRPGACEEVDGNWDDVAENVEKIYALSSGSNEDHASQEIREMLEERFRRPVGVPVAARLGMVADQFGCSKGSDFDLEIEVEMIVYGATKAGAYVTLSGEPVKVREDGTFIVKMDFPDKRQIFPIVARTKDGVEQRTVALAVERNTKVMDPVSREGASF